MAVVQITSREFREKQASMFALADAGTQVVIRRRGKLSYLRQKRSLINSWILYEYV